LNNASGSDAASVITITNAINATSSPSNTLASQSGTVTQSALSGAGSAMKQVAGVAQSRVSPAGGQSSGKSGVSSGNEVSSYDGRRAMWLQGVGGFGEIDSDANGNGADYDVYGTAAGFEFELEDHNAMLGLFAGYSFTESDVKGLNDSSEVDSYQLGIYGAYRFDKNWHMNGSLSGSYLDFDTERQVGGNIAGADFDGYGGYASAELLYDFQTEHGAIISPFAALEGGFTHHEDYSETGAGVLNMDVASSTNESLTSVIGIQATAMSPSSENFQINPSVKLGWAHEYLDDTAEQSSNFAAAPSAVINSEGPVQNRNSARIGAHIDVKNMNSTTSFYAGYDGELASDFNNHLFTAGLKVRW